MTDSTSCLGIIIKVIKLSQMVTLIDPVERNKIVSLSAFFAASVAAAQAQTTITAWNFDSDYVSLKSGREYNSSPAPSTGYGMASILGLGNHYCETNSINGAYILAAPGCSDGFYDWCISGDDDKLKIERQGDGWSSLPPIGSQHAEFDVSMAGFYNIQISFDVATAQSERNVQGECTINDSTRINASLTLAESPGSLEDNTCSRDTVDGSDVELGLGWNNGSTVNLAGISGVHNDPDFSIRIVNTSISGADVKVVGNSYNDVPDDWFLDNVVVPPIPEPGTVVMAGLAGLTFFFLRRAKNDRLNLPNSPEYRGVLLFADMY